MSPPVHGPGILYVPSRLKYSIPTPLPSSTFLEWYDDDHLPELVSTSGINSSFRFVNTSKDAAATPNLVYDQLDDLAFTTTDEFRNIRVTSDILPGGGLVYDYAEFEVMYFGLSGVVGKRGGDSVRFVVTERFSTEKGVGRSAFEACHEEFAKVAQSSGYIRTLSFQLQLVHSNAQSNAAGKAEPGSWLCIHEFSAKSGDAILGSLGELSEKHLGVRGVERDVWELVKTFGEGRFFE